MVYLRPAILPTTSSLKGSNHTVTTNAAIRRPGLWRHKTRPILFSLVVNDFGIKYKGKQHALHLINAIEQTLRILYGLDRFTTLWNYSQVGLSQSHSRFVYAQLHFGHVT